MSDILRKFRRGATLLGELIKYETAALCAGVLKVTNPRYRHVWLVSERGREARDNGYHYFAYLRRAHPEINAVYVADPKLPDYDRAALAEIFLRFCGGRIAVADDFAAAVQAYFAALPDAVLKSKNFSNARFVRNLFERTCGKATMRARLAGEAAVVLTKEDLRAAGSDREFAAMMEKKPKRMGFGI